LHSALLQNKCYTVYNCTQCCFVSSRLLHLLISHASYFYNPKSLQPFFFFFYVFLPCNLINPVHRHTSLCRTINYNHSLFYSSSCCLFDYSTQVLHSGRQPFFVFVLVTFASASRPNSIALPPSHTLRRSYHSLIYVCFLCRKSVGKWTLSVWINT